MSSPLFAVGAPNGSHRGFVAFLIARFAGMFATQIQAVVVAWQVYDATRDPMALAWVGLAQFLPMLLLLMPAGDLIDRHARRFILMASWGLAALCALAFWRLAGGGLHDSGHLLGMYAVLCAFGCSRAFSGPCTQSLLPQIVSRAQLAQAIATNGMLMRVAAIGGPLAGGFLYAAAGPEATYLVCAAGFFLGACCLIPVKTPYADTPCKRSGETIWRRFGAGIRFIFQRRIILGSISLDLFAVLLGGVVALLPIYAKEILHTGADGLGLLRSAVALGEVGAGVWLSFRPQKHAIGPTLFAAVTVFGCANLVFALSSWFWLSFAMLAIAGAADMWSVYIRGALLQFATPDAMRGRVSAVNMLFVGSSNELGEFRAGIAARLLGPVAAAVFGGLCTLGVVLLWRRWFASLYRLSEFGESLSDRAIALEHHRG